MTTSALRVALEKHLADEAKAATADLQLLVVAAD
jgi:hypothetical protein